VAESNSDRQLTSAPPISAAHQSGVSESAILRSEQVNGTPPMQLRNLNAIRRVFEEHGIEFLGLDGVRLLIK
jgi:hypothetical protein